MFLQPNGAETTSGTENQDVHRSNNMNQEAPSFGSVSCHDQPNHEGSNSSHNLDPSDITNITMGDTIKTSAPSMSKMTTITKNKKRSHPRSSKSKPRDPRRRSPITAVHKKKRPGTGSRKPHASPKSSPSSQSFTSVYRGHLWIRPIAVKVAPHPLSPKQERRRVGGATMGCSLQREKFVSTSSANCSTIRPTYDDDELVLMHMPGLDFDSCQRHHGSGPGSTIRPRKNKRIIFGESGKPIVPRSGLMRSTFAPLQFRP
mmetsp:Transcript_6076/g.15203  ORF Transcript_6076/g.15203 Transcript_6076/m.15203 type:complete len:259 (+) Transcript_6076:286-1062(+)